MDDRAEEPAGRYLARYGELRAALAVGPAREALSRVDAVVAAVAAELASIARGEGAGAGGTVLLVDDEPSMLFLMGEFLEGEGHRLVTASDGLQAQSILRDGPDRFDAVVIDRVMPGVSGLALLAWLQDDPALEALPAILQSGSGSVQDHADGIAAGAWYYLAKPYDIDLFRALVRVAIRHGSGAQAPSNRPLPEGLN